MKKWLSMMTTLFLMAAVLAGASGCGSDAKDGTSTRLNASKEENPEEIFQNFLKKAADKKVPMEEVIAMDESIITLMTTPDVDGKAVISQIRNNDPDDLRYENITVSNIRTRGSLMAAEVTGSSVYTSRDGQKSRNHQSGTVVLRNENGVWKQLICGIVEVIPIKSVEVISGEMKNVSIYGNIGKLFTGEQVVFLSFKNNGMTDYSMGWVNPPVISAITDAGEVRSRALPQYDLTPPVNAFRLTNQTLWVTLPFSKVNGVIQEIKFTDFHVLEGGLPSEGFAHPVLTLRIVM